MATKKTPARATRQAPARAPSKPKLAIVPPAPAADGTVVLVYRGGADLSFRDGSGTKRRVLRGVPFEVDGKTAELLLATDPTVVISTSTSSPAPEAVPPARSRHHRAAATRPPTTRPLDVPDEAGTPPEAQPEAPAGDMPSGAITLGDLPSGAENGKG